ncbi:histidine phosphatase family protein [Bacillus sp. APMAM]|nr:histidine phosphatase family protein [Bacillus sp. APMAM]RTZ55786.1 histidine phosphatase family protein [Bacillus sp. SAJ1]
MEISLIRHGKSTLKEHQRITCDEFRKWIQKYNDHGVLTETSFPPHALEKIAHAKVVMTSDLKRAVESAKLLNPPIKTIADSVFREVELPIPKRKLSRIKLHPGMWSVTMKCLWYWGYSSQCESISKAKERAIRASKILIEYAEKHQSVVLVGHGVFNLFIAKELHKLGWKGHKRSGTKHWSCSTYSLYNHNSL